MKPTIMNALTTKTSFQRGVALSVMTKATLPVTGSDPFNRTIRAALDTIDSSTLQPVAPSDAGAAFQPKAMLATIIYCYARQIYGSSDIENLLADNLDESRLCPNMRPDAHLIQEFRRKNRQAVQLCLMTALWLLGQQKVKDGTVTKVSDAHLEEEASRRITMAMFTDSVELGGG